MKLTIGDIIYNGWAGQGNPIRFSVFIGYSGKFAKCVYLTPQGKLEQIKYYKDDLIKNEENRYKTVAFLPFYETIKNELAKLLELEGKK